MGSDQSVPHVATSDVSRSMEVGKIISIKARVNLQPTRFAVNLKCANGDIAFHFNPRFNENPQVVVCNTQTGVEWGHEEQNHQMPFRPGEPFLLTITIQNTHYEVSVNGKNYLRYDHRLPFHSVKELEIWGDIKLEDSGSPSIMDPPPYNSFTQNDTPTIVIRDPEKKTSKSSKRHNPDKMPSIEMQEFCKDERDGHMSEESEDPGRSDQLTRAHASNDKQSQGRCLCELFVRPQWIKCTRWKIRGGASIEVRKAS